METRHAHKLQPAIAIAAVHAALLLLACNATEPRAVDVVSESPAPASQPEAVEEVPAKRSGPRLDLNLLRPSEDGDVLVSWGSMVDAAKRRLICSVRLSTRRARCSDEAETTEVVEVSPSGRFVLLGMPNGFILRETSSDARVFEHPMTVPLLAGGVSPDDRFLAVIDTDGLGHVFDIHGGRRLWKEQVTEAIAPPGAYIAKRWTNVRWLDRDRVAFEGRAAPTIVMVDGSDAKRAVVGDFRLATSSQTSWECSAVVPFDGQLLGLSCTGLIALFDAKTGVERKALAQGGRLDIFESLDVERAGDRFLLRYWAVHQGLGSRLEVVEPASRTAILWSHDGPVVDVGLRLDGTVGWSEEKPPLDSMEMVSFAKNVTNKDAPRSLPGMFRNWSGSNVIGTDPDGVTLHENGAEVFRHDPSWAPWAVVERRGQFVWISGGNSMVRIKDGSAKPLVFDVFGSAEAPVVALVAPSTKPPSP